MTRIYYGCVYPVSGAVYLTDSGYDYQILDTETNSQKAYRKAYIKCGFDRELEVHENAKLILQVPDKKDKIISIPFKSEDGRLVFDLPCYFKEKKIKFKLYKRDTRDCSGTEWNQVSYKTSISSKGEIGWSSNWCIDYMEYFSWVSFSKKHLYINNMPVKYIEIDRQTNTMDTPTVRKWFEELINNEPFNVSLKDFLNSLKETGINVNKHFFRVDFWGDKNIYRVEISKKTGEPTLKKSIY